MKWVAYFVVDVLVKVATYNEPILLFKLDGKETHFFTCFRLLRIANDCIASCRGCCRGADIPKSGTYSSGFSESLLRALNTGFASLLIASISAPYRLRWSSYLLSLASNSASGNLFLRLLGGSIVEETHWTRALVQFAHGSLRSHFTFRCWQSTQGCFRRL